MAIALVVLQFPAYAHPPAADLSASTPATLADPAAATSARKPIGIANYGSLPLAFEVNRGQAGSSADYVARGRGYTLALTGSGASLSLRAPATQAAPTIRMEFLSAASRPEPFASAPLPGKVNYLIGDDPSRWLTNLETFGRVGYRGLYSGIDVVYYGNQGQLEYDLLVAPRADPGLIRFGFDGVGSVRIGAQGELALSVSDGDLTLRRPHAYQTIDGARVPVPASYAVEDGEVAFRLGAYDASRPLVIDPVLAYSTFLGGDGSDLGLAIAVDRFGSAYVTGQTSGSFPTTEGAYGRSVNGGDDVFVAKLNPHGSALVYATYIGGSAADAGSGIAVDAAGNAYVTGRTASTNFPTTAGAPQTTARGGIDGFVTKLNAAGSGLVYSTYLGGGGDDEGFAIALDASRNALVTGYTKSENFPTTVGAFQATYRGGLSDAFVTKLNAAGTALVYSTFLGGSGKPAEDTVVIALGDYAQGIAVDSAGNAYVAGSTDSRNFPTTPGAFQTTHASVVNADGSGFYDGFVTKLTPSGVPVYSTFLGGGRTDHATAIDVDSAGHAYVTGATASIGGDFGAPFPTTASAFATTYNYGGDAFVTKLNDKGTGLDYSTYLGGSPAIESSTGHDEGNAIVADANGNAYVTGRTNALNFPTVDAFQTARAGGDDAFVSRIDTKASGAASLVWSSYLGGAGQDFAAGIARDAAGSVYVTGGTASAGFPTTAGALRTTFGGLVDGFVTKIAKSSLSGQARCPSGRTSVAISGAAVQLLQGDVLLDQTTANSDGFFDFFGVGAGTFTLKYIEPAFEGPGRTCTQTVTVDANGVATFGSYDQCRKSNTWLTPIELPANRDTGIRSEVRGVICDGGRLWYKITIPKLPTGTGSTFTVPPLSRIVARLTGTDGGRLPGDFTLMLVKDPNLALRRVSKPADAHTQFAGDTFGGDTFGGDTFGGDTFGGDTFGGDTFGGDTFGGDTFGGDTFGGDTFGGDTFGGDTFGGDTFGGDTFGGDTFGGDTFGGDTFGGDTFGGAFATARALKGLDPKAYSAAIARSVVRVSAHRGTSQEGLWQNTWANEITWYLRVSSHRGAAGAFNLSSQVFTGLCKNVSIPSAKSLLGPPTDSATKTYNTLILRNSLAEGTYAGANLIALQSLASQPTPAHAALVVNGAVVDFGLDAGLAAVYQQYKDNPFCPAAANIIAEGIRGYIKAFQEANPELKWILIAASDEGIPLFRVPDYAHIAPQNMLVMPLKPETVEGELRLNMFGTDDAYADLDPIQATDHLLFIPKLGVGRVSEPKHVETMVTEFVRANGLLTPQTAGVYGYNFWNDSATSIQKQLTDSGKSVNQFPTAHPKIQSGQGLPTDADAWNAQDLIDGVAANTDVVVLMAHGLRASEIAPANYFPTVKPQQLINVANTTPAIKRLKLLVTGACNFALSVPSTQGIKNVTADPRTAEIPQALGWTAVAWDAYAYGDDERIAYSEELADDLFRELRYGAANEVVVLGDAIARVKRDWAARQTDLKGIHQKTLMSMGILGFPMLRVNMGATGRLGARPDGLAAFDGTALVGVPAGTAGSDPALNLRTRSGDITINFDNAANQLVRADVNLTNTDASGTTRASYYKVQTPANATGFVQMNPLEPITPRWSVPLHPRGLAASDGTFARGTVLMSATCQDETQTTVGGVTQKFVPLISAPAYQLTPPRGPYLADRFEPNNWWEVNYLDPRGEFLLVRPGQFRSTRSATGAPEIFGTERTFRLVTFRAYYSSLVDAEISDTSNNKMQAIHAGPPEFLRHSAIPNGAGTAVDFETLVSALPNVGIQSVFVTWWNEDATCGATGSGLNSIALTNDGTSQRWSGSLPLPAGASTSSIRYLLQAVSGAGRVRVADNFGLGFPAETPPTLPAPLVDTLLDFAKVGGSTPPTVEIVASGRKLTVQAHLSRTDTNANVTGKRLLFRLSGVNGDRAFAYTGADGIATATLKVNALPGSFFVHVEFEGNDELSGSSARSSGVTVTRETTTFTDLLPLPATQQQGGTIQVSALLRDGLARPLREQGVLFLITAPACTTYPQDATDPSVPPSCAVLQAQGAETDFAGRARASIPLRLANGASYRVHVAFSGKVKVPTGDVLSPSQTLDLRNARYLPARASLGEITVVKDRIAFTSSRTGNGDIYSMAVDGSDPVRLTDNAALDADPDWSPDRTKIAFTSRRTGNGDIYVMNADGTSQTQLTVNAAVDALARWSPDGTKLAFTSNRDGNFEIYVMNADGSGVVRLTNHPAVDANPFWSPDGTKIAFTSNRTGNVDIYVMNSNGTGVVRLTTNAAVDTLGSWSPDGSKIVFSSSRTGNGDIYVMNANGTGQTRLTDSLGIDATPHWSPDGTQIVFSSNRDGNWEIYTMKADGSAQTRRTFHPANDTLPSW
jgi:hypothetical protein